MQVDSTGFTSMGQRLKIHFGDRMYTIAFTSYARRNTDGGIRDPLSTLSLEYLLHQRKVGFTYLNFNKLSVDSRWRQAFISGLDQGASLSEVWSEQMDMLFYIDLNYDVHYDKTSHVGILQHGCLLYQGDLSELLNSIEKRIHIRLDKVDLLHSVCKEVQIDSRIKSESILEVILSNDTTYDRLIELLGQGGYRISAIQPLENTLESVYLKLTSQTK